MNIDLELEPENIPSRDIVDETSEASFPASDPPSWGPLRVGSPNESRASTAAISPPTLSHAFPPA